MCQLCSLPARGFFVAPEFKSGLVLDGSFETKVLKKSCCASVHGVGKRGGGGEGGRYSKLGLRGVHACCFHDSLNLFWRSFVAQKRPLWQAFDVS